MFLDIETNENRLKNTKIRHLLHVIIASHKNRKNRHDSTSFTCNIYGFQE